LITRIRRAIGSGVSFALFGLSGLVLAFAVFPVLRRLPGSQEERELRCQAVVRRFFRGFLRFTEAIGVLRLRVTGVDSLREPGQLVVANHPTLLDAVFLMSLMPQADCVVNRAALVAGFPTLTLGVLLALGYAQRYAGGVHVGPAQIVWGIFTWGVLGWAVFVRTVRHWGGRRAAVASIAGFGAVVLVYVALKLSEPGAERFL
jgi:ABC-type transport system involved in cytochrome c biogenesis permease subunit